MTFSQSNLSGLLGANGSMASSQKKSGFISGFIQKKILGDKKKERPITSILDVKKVKDNPRAIEIVFAEKNSNKAIVYECVNIDNQSEILAKLNFLLVIHP